MPQAGQSTVRTLLNKALDIYKITIDANISATYEQKYNYGNTMGGTFESDTGGTFNPLLSVESIKFADGAEVKFNADGSLNREGLTSVPTMKAKTDGIYAERLF